ncbi:TIGR04141 family sporadically distributed protein [Lachnospiraceae bacterium MD1]|uniref:TIGR04141 family sporadically distributed protein n=1 Tax=Variimorphobacter saccharofermentans TaxID=2755051 RepID=A0A839JY56_9FIRM|nr:DUF6119 family protein [Variimorphobacter saccharofermentans]MBB2182147.1 TIGR04141 family sporadically distributed protein [Variimorphobacter saccharofermentans]
MKELSTTKRTKEILNVMLGEIRHNIEERENSTQKDINIDGFIGVVYRTINTPDWDGMITYLFGQMNEKINFELENINVSYILFYPIKESIYAMTAGFGNHLIKNYIERSWGLYLMPKILGDDEGVIREVKENNLYGNALAVSKANRYTTNLLFEKKMSAVFKELSIEVDDEVAEIFGISDKKKKRKTSVLLKDSLNLRKSIDIKKLKTVLSEIYEIEKKKDQYSMGYFLSAKKIGISNANLFEALQECIINNELDKFVLIGDDYQKYCVDAEEYIITDETGTDCYTSDVPITFKELIEFISEDKELSRNYISIVMKKWKIQTKDSSGNTLLFPVSIFNALQGFVEFGEQRIPCFLMQGEWYCLNIRYISILDEEFKKRMDENSELVNAIKTKFNLISKSKTEDSYNDSFFSREKIIVAHKALVDRFEIADLIFWDDQTLYIMCNKMKFDASGTRDLTNQIWASANYLQARLNSRERNSFLADYYAQISDRYNKEGQELIIEKERFVELFDRHIVFIAGYMSGYSLRCKSYYAKYLDVDSYKKMLDMGYDYITMNIRD